MVSVGCSSDGHVPLDAHGGLNLGSLYRLDGTRDLCVNLGSSDAIMIEDAPPKAVHCACMSINQLCLKYAV